MTRKKVQLAWVANENSRNISLKKRRLGLIKKVKELTILCDVKACLVMFSPNEAEPMVWPSLGGARALLHEFFALPEIEKKKKELNLEQYIKEKTDKVQELFVKSQKKNTKLKVDKLMVQLHRGREIEDLNSNEIYDLISSLHSNIMLMRKKLVFMTHPPLREPPPRPLPEAAQPEELRTTTNDVFVGGGHEDKRDGRIDEAVKNICINNASGNQTCYVLDQWVYASPEPPNHRSHNIEMTSYNGRRYLPYRGSSSNGGPNLEMQSIGSPTMNYHGMVGSVSHAPQHHHMNPNMIMSQPRQYPLNFMNGVKEEGGNISNDDSQFNMSIDNGLLQEPSLNLNGAPTDEGNGDGASFDVNKICPGF